MHVEIPAYQKVFGKHEKHSFTVFQIDVFYNERHHTVFKRYTEFDRLNSKLIQNKISVPTFPGKTVLKWSPKTLEYRRQVFEDYLNAHCTEEILIFLQADQRSPESLATPGLVYREFSRTPVRIDQSVVAFQQDLRLSENGRGNMSESVVSGVLQAYYDHV